MNENGKYKLLSNINSPADLKKLSMDQLPDVCRELRSYIIEQLSTNPGHLASSLGAIEITVAIHYVFDTPEDRIVWDVGIRLTAIKFSQDAEILFIPIGDLMVCIRFQLRLRAYMTRLHVVTHQTPFLQL
jgi:hypothetical protein